MSPWEALALHDSEVMFDHEVDETVNVWLDGAHDDDASSVSADGWHAFQVENVVVASDSLGFNYGHRYHTVAEATSVMDALHEVEANDDITQSTNENGD